MNKKKPTSLVIITLLLLSTLIIIYTPTAKANNTVKHTATVSPTVTTVPEVKYTFNITNTSNNTDVITNVTIIFPATFTNMSVQPPSGWTYNVTGWPTITFNNDTSLGLAVNASALFNVTVLWPAVPPTTTTATATLRVNCTSDGTESSSNPVELTVSFNPQFTATITPTHVKGNTNYLFNVTVVNVASTTGLGTINITYPSGWIFNSIVNYGGSRTWTTVHDSATNTFKLTGPNLLINEYVWIQVNMTTPGTSSDTDPWNATVWDSSSALLGTRNLLAVVDASPPTVSITEPGANINYTVGFGNRIWINGTVNDDLNITKYGVTVSINDTRFERVSFTKNTDIAYAFSFANTTAIPDGPLAVNVTATDAAGNINSTARSARIDNTAPQIVWVKVLDQTGAELPYAAGVYWMGAGTTGIRVNASFYNPAGVSGYIYLNTTRYSFDNGTAIPSSPDSFDVRGSDYVTLKITLVDGASPTPNNFTQTWEIKRDKVKPSTPTFTAEPICGGAIIKGLNATDNVGVLSYAVYVNGSLAVNVALTCLNAATLTSVGSHRTFAGTLVLDLTGYAGKVANITIAAVDYGANEGNATTSIISVPKERWYPIVLEEGWNLISLPLVPANSTIQAVLSSLLKEGTLVSVWHYDAETATWHSYAPGAPPDLTTMVDGKGYFIKVTAYNVLIVQGTEQPPPPSTPRVYHVVPGWNLIGYKRLDVVNASTYLSGVDWVRLYEFDAATQTYQYVLPSDDMTIGLGYWVAVRTEGWIYP